MPEVRRRDADTVSRQPGDAGLLRVSATPDAFGAGVGQALQGLAQTGEQFGQVLRRRQDENDLTAAKQADLEYTRSVDGLLQGEGGLYTKAGDAAVAETEHFPDLLQKARAEVSSRLTPAQAKLFDQSAAQRDVQWGREIGGFRLREEKASALGASTGRKALAERDFARTFDADPDAAAKAEAISEGETIAQGRLNGAAPELVQAQLSKDRSDRYAGVVSAQAQSDPLAARRTLDRYGDRIDPLVGAKLGKDIRTMADQREAALVFDGLPSIGGAQEIIDYVIDEHEGEGLNANDNGRPSKFGIRADAADGTYKGKAVADLTRAEASAIYQRDFWSAIGGDKLVRQNPAAAYVAYDAAVNHGVGYAKKLMTAAGGDPQKMIELRRAEYVRLAKADPGKYGDDLAGWNSRMKKLEIRIGGLKPQTAGEVEEAAQALGGGDPERTAAFRAAGNAARTRQDAIVRDAREGRVDRVWKFAETATDETQIPSADWLALQPKERDAFRSHFAGNASGVKVRTDPATYGSVLDMAATDPRAFQAADLTQLIGKLDPSDYQELAKMQLTARQGGGSWKAQAVSLEATNRAFAVVKPATLKGDAEQSLRAAHFQAVRAATTLKGGALTDAEMIDVGTQLVAGTATGKGLFGEKDVKLVDMKAGQVPKPARERILRDWYARNARPITDVEILNAYRAGAVVGAFK